MESLDRYLSQQRGLQARLAKQLGLSAGTLSSIRSGRRRPSAALAKRIEAATDGEVRAMTLLGLEETGATFDHETAPRPTSSGRWSVSVSPDGSLHLPAGMLRALEFAPGERLLFTPAGDHVRLHSTDKALNAIQAEFLRLVPEGASVVDDFLADKRAEAARESRE